MTSKRDLNERVKTLETENRRLAAQNAGLTGTNTHYKEVIIPNILQIIFQLPAIISEMLDVSFEGPATTFDHDGIQLDSKYLKVRIFPYKRTIQFIGEDNGPIWQTGFNFEDGSFEPHFPEVIREVEEYLGITSGNIARINAS